VGRGRTVDGFAAADPFAEAAVSTEFGEAGDGEIADAAEPGEGIGLSAASDTEAAHFGDAAGDEGSLGIVTEAEAVTDSGGDGHDVFEGAAEFDAQDIVAGVDAEGWAMEKFLDLKRFGGVGWRRRWRWGCRGRLRGRGWGRRGRRCERGGRVCSRTAAHGEAGFGSMPLVTVTIPPEKPARGDGFAEGGLEGTAATTRSTSATCVGGIEIGFRQLTVGGRCRGGTVISLRGVAMFDQPCPVRTPEGNRCRWSRSSLARAVPQAPAPRMVTFMGWRIWGTEPMRCSVPSRRRWMFERCL
jgi:hypothetical protein